MNVHIAKFVLGLLVILSVTCSAPARFAETFLSGTPTPISSQTSEASPPILTSPANTPSATFTTAPRQTATGRSTATLEVQSSGSGSACSYHPLTAQLLEQTSQEQWIDWVAKLSGAEPVTIDGEETRIETRYSPSLFDGSENARAFEWLLDQVEQWYPAAQIDVQPFNVANEEQRFTWQNLIITIPGQTRPDEIVVLGAHLDSTSEQPERLAPGAEDNASGSATLLEAARLFRNTRFERTLQIIWFTGEEQGLLGSQAYLRYARANDWNVVGALNLDMFGYDSDNDRCFELHVGTLPDSREIGECVQTVIESYELDLKTDFLTSEATDRSDHGSFWEAGVGAVEVLENMMDNDQPLGCANRDPSPHYHTTDDVVSSLNPVTAFSIAKASLAATAGLASPVNP